MFKTILISYTHDPILNIYIVYKLGASSPHNDDPMLKNCFFGVVALTKNADIDKYGCSSYVISFVGKSRFPFQDSGFGQNIIFGVDMSSSIHVDNKKKDIKC